MENPSHTSETSTLCCLKCVSYIKGQENVSCEYITACKEPGGEQLVSLVLRPTGQYLEAFLKTYFLCYIIFVS